MRDSIRRIEEENAVVLGVSADSVESHRRFKEKHGINFVLLADTGHEVAETYGVWKRKSMFGKKYWGIERSSFVIDASGRIAHAHRDVGAREHADLVIAEVAAL